MAAAHRQRSKQGRVPHWNRDRRSALHAPAPVQPYLHGSHRRIHQYGGATVLGRTGWRDRGQQFVFRQTERRIAGGLRRDGASGSAEYRAAAGVEAEEGRWMSIFAVIRTHGAAWLFSSCAQGDPWATRDLLRVSRISPWTLRQGSL